MIMGRLFDMYKIKAWAGFAGKEEYDDFLLLPTPCVAYTKINEDVSCYAIGLKAGYWGIYIAWSIANQKNRR